ncbi:MAG: hypothetical protein F4185_08245 [Chloroflexi bacterium]|nr:hypothetical protein [Chloroflexota bacterium]MYF65823.1 hypothetical protein [Chloroflexota bacterium]
MLTAIHGLLADPHPDGETKAALPFPFRYGTLVLGAAGFLITYSIENAEVIWVRGIEPQRRV